jgi:thiol-disulfide isomerase/thioredoxin
MKLLTLVAFVVALVATACTAGPEMSPSQRASSSVPASALVAGHAGTVQGPTFDASSLDGRPVVLWFWSPSCTICRAEGPEVATVASELAASESGVALIGVAGRGDRAEMAEFVEATGTGELTHLVDADGTIWSRLGVIGQPAFAFVSADGHVDLFAGSLGESALRTRVLTLEAGVA